MRDTVSVFSNIRGFLPYYNTNIVAFLCGIISFLIKEAK